MVSKLTFWDGVFFPYAAANGKNIHPERLTAGSPENTGCHGRGFFSSEPNHHFQVQAVNLWGCVLFVAVEKKQDLSSQLNPLILRFQVLTAGINLGDLMIRPTCSILKLPSIRPLWIGLQVYPVASLVLLPKGWKKIQNQDTRREQYRTR